jgi:hypothetical protein
MRHRRTTEVAPLIRVEGARGGGDPPCVVAHDGVRGAAVLPGPALEAEPRGAGVVVRRDQLPRERVRCLDEGELLRARVGNIAEVDLEATPPQTTKGRGSREKAAWSSSQSLVRDGDWLPRAIDSIARRLQRMLCPLSSARRRGPVRLQARSDHGVSVTSRRGPGRSTSFVVTERSCRETPRRGWVGQLSG